jgi:hypothetical protein
MKTASGYGSEEPMDTEKIDYDGKTYEVRDRISMKADTILRLPEGEYLVLREKREEPVIAKDVRVGDGVTFKTRRGTEFGVITCIIAEGPFWVSTLQGISQSIWPEDIISVKRNGDVVFSSSSLPPPEKESVSS